jgi:hypothetical protein
MKINIDNTIKITGRLNLQSLTKNIGGNGEISANVLKKIDGRFALLEIAGQRIRAEFLKGVPDQNRLLLELRDGEKNTFTFRIVREAVSNPFKDIAGFVLIDSIDLRKYILNINKLSNIDYMSLYAFNAKLLKNEQESDEKEKSIIKTLNLLLKYGIKKDDLGIFSYLFCNKIGINNKNILILLKLFGIIDDNQIGELGNYYKDEKNIGKWVTDFIDNIKQILNNNKEDSRYLVENIIYQLYDIISDKGGDIKRGYIPYLDGDEFRLIRVLSAKSSVLCSVTLSYLGHVELLLKNNMKSINISIICDDDKRGIIQGNINELYDRLKAAIKRNIDINVLSRAGFKEKIIDLINSLYNISSIDIKV